MAIRYLIVDDELPSRLNLRLAMAAHPGWQLAGECGGAASARAALAGLDVDLVFLDIQMPGQSGLVLARELSRLREPPLVVFVTAYSEHAIEAFEVHALDYLLKPLDDARLAQAVERAASMLRQRQREAYGAALRGFVDGAQSLDTISVRSVGRIEQVKVGDILRIESAGNYVELRLAGRTVLHRMTLSRLESLLAPGEFVRVHRGTIVRRSQIAGMETRGDGSYWLSMRNGEVVAVSERYAGALKAILMRSKG
ncbi:LytR/AlgR family response regulator transcription factor [Massilia sp. BHUDP2]|uniref:LytR/AlgR family response regulator transcription factor n=1 Tax=Massilia sp. BHUDP2 TaxID=3034505 RepID=UPI00390674ED